jgi:hypothetical protein
MTGQIRFARWAGLCAILGLGASSVILSGCSGDVMDKGLVPVKGRVTLDGGPWPAPGTITFTPKEAPGATQNGLASFDASGDFGSVDGGFGGAKGLHPGTYLVSVQCREGEEGMPDPSKPASTLKDHVPAKYRDPKTSELTLQVDAGKAVDATFDVKSK